MKKISAVIQIALVLLVIGYGTYHLYQGNFEVSMATLPVLIGYYLFMIARKNRTETRSRDHLDRK